MKMNLLWLFLLWDARQKTPAPAAGGGSSGPIGLLFLMMGNR
jgi:hypothetical protein